MPSKEDRDDNVQPPESQRKVIDEALSSALESVHSAQAPSAMKPAKHGAGHHGDHVASGARPAKKPKASIMLMDVPPDKDTVTSVRDIILALDADAKKGSGSDDSLETRRKLNFSDLNVPDARKSISQEIVSGRQAEMTSKQKRRVSMAASSAQRRSPSPSESSQAGSSSPPATDASVVSLGRDHDRDRDRDRSRQSLAAPRQSLAPVASLMPRASKIFRRNYDDAADTPPDTMRGRASIMSMHVHRRSLAPGLPTADLLDSAERRQEAMVVKAREQMERMSWLNTPLKMDDDDDDYFHDRWFGEIPGEWPSLTDMRRAWAVGWEYRAVYKGTWGPYDTAEGRGTLTRPLKVEYEGEFQDGMCHGAGAIHYPNGAVIRGTWERGRLLQPAYIASDGLNFDPDGPYCMMPDRRFYTEIQQGLRPAGRSQLTNAHPPRPVPSGCYDAGDGIFDPRRNCVYDPDTLEVVRVPTKDQMQWIKENCRKGWDENVGFKPELYENWWMESPPSSVSAAEEEAEEEEEEEAEEEEERAGEEEAEEEEGWALEEGSVRLEPTMEERFDAEFEEEPLPAHVAELYPPIAVQDAALDATPAEDIYPFLFPETEEEGATVVEKLMVPVSTEVTQENLRMRQRYLNALEADRAAMDAREHMEKKREEEEAAKAKEAAEKAKSESPPATPRLSLDETEEVYKGPWRHVARRLVPMLRQRLETDRKTAARKWQDDLVRLLTERDTKAGLEMSTSGYLGAAQSVADLSKPRTSRVIIPPGLEERARQRRAEREEREREAEEKRQAEAMAKQAAKEQGLRAAEAGSDSDDEADRDAASAPGSERGSDLDAAAGDEEVPEMPKRRPSVLPTSALATPKGGRMSVVPEDRGPSKSLPTSAKKSLSFKPDAELEA